MAMTADDVRQVVFDRAPFGTRGYHELEVNVFLRRIADTLDGEDTLTARDVHNVAFSRPPLGKRGYDQAEVDAFLRQVETTLVGNGPAIPSPREPGYYVAPALEHTHARKPLWRRSRTHT